MLPINLSELDFQFGDDYIVDTRPIRYTRSTCEYRPEEEKELVLANVKLINNIKWLQPVGDEDVGERALDVVVNIYIN